MSVVKWQCPDTPGNEQDFPCPSFEAHGFPVTGDFSTAVWPDWAATLIHIGIAVLSTAGESQGRPFPVNFP